ncbi:hypothetical protein EXIGLDRAFT_381413 [Exidia glandulosa HHB12029]|uniref:Uncharacterized protein n=1 Tax=Exidia glandulosa HHB12029 TaxID=1314781 RepID=A0A165BZN6_EXIGL|nr:hypothetical protein EXIGLDRAFT_381413 [Exidia glandulosa HHB12029]
MDDEVCAVCSRPALAGRDACRNADAAASSSSLQTTPSRPLSVHPPSALPPPINTYSYPRRSSHSIDISASDRESSASASSLARTSPPSSPEEDEDDDEDSDFYSHLKSRRLSTTACTPRDGDPYSGQQSPQPALLRLQFSRRPSQTNNRAMIPVLLGQHRRHVSLADQVAQPVVSPTRSRFPPSPAAGTPPVSWRYPVVAGEAPARKKDPLVEKDTKTSRHIARQSLPAYFGRLGVSPKPSPPLQPLVTITNVDTTGERLPSPDTAPTAASVPLGRTLSDATVRLARDQVRALFAPTAASLAMTKTAATVSAVVEDRAVDGDDSEVERVIEPLRGRARNRTRRESTVSVDERVPVGGHAARAHVGLSHVPPFSKRTRRRGSRGRSRSRSRSP